MLGFKKLRWFSTPWRFKRFFADLKMVQSMLFPIASASARERFITCPWYMSFSGTPLLVICTLS